MRNRKRLFGSLFAVLVALMFTYCQGPEGPAGPKGEKGETGDPGDAGVSIVWKGEFDAAPAKPELYWAYFNTSNGNAYIYDGAGWELLSRRGADGADGSDGADGTDGINGTNGVNGANGANGVSINWRGSLTGPPTGAQLNWAYYNSTDGKSYIYNGTEWQLLAKDGEIGPQGLTGNTGGTGAAGGKGDKGDKGDNGDPNGPQGPKGDDGEGVYLVVFNSMGGEPAIDAVGVDRGGTVDELPFEKTGCTLEGWYTDKSLTTAYDFDAAVTKNLTLYAKWTVNVKTVTIGTQTWMAENLNIDVPGSVCYDDNPDNCAKYGRLYDWATAMNGASTSSDNPSGVRGVCPAGWHLPSDAEWDVLTDFVGTNAGTALKSTTGWNDGDSYYKPGADDYGFAALPGGSGDGGDFYNVGEEGSWWSATGLDDSEALFRWMHYSLELVGRQGGGKSSLLSVRCVQD